MELSEIIAEGERLHACYEKNSNGGWELERNEYANYNIWLQTCLAYMEAYHPNSYSIKIFQLEQQIFGTTIIALVSLVNFLQY